MAGNQVWIPNLQGSMGGWAQPATKGQQGAIFSPGVGYYLPPGTNPPTQNTPIAASGAQQPPTSVPYKPPVLSQTYAPTGQGPVGVNGSYVPPQQNALTQIQQISPATYNLLQRTAGGMNREQRNAQQTYNQVKGLWNNALAGQLPAGVLRDVTQQTAANQAASGNSQGVAQAAEQAMTTGEAGLGYQQQELGNLDTQGGYLSNVLNQAQGYLTSGATPVGMGTSYLNNAIAEDQGAVSGQPMYQSGVGQINPYSYINPNAGSEFAQGAQGYMNAGAGATPGSPGNAGLIGAGVSAAAGLTSSLISSGALASLGGALAAF